MKNPFKRYTTDYSEKSFWKKLKGYARQAGMKVVYTGLLLYYAYKRKETPAWAKRLVLGVLGYFISPFDVLPDLTPIVGYTDDLGVLTFGLVAIASYVNKDVKLNARKQLHKWFGETDEAELREVEEHLREGKEKKS